MNRNLDIDLMRTFVLVAEHASMTAAANARHLTQGAVSQHVKRLESTLDCSLFERSRRGLRLTQAGEQLLPKARRLLHLNDDIWSSLGVDQVRGKVRLGVPYDLVGTYMAPVLRAYADAYPQVDISLQCAASPELLAMLDNGELDLVVVEQLEGVAGGERLRLEPLVWVGARDGRAHLKSTVPISLVADTCAFRPSVLAALEKQGKAWRTMFESGNIEATTATVRADLAITAWLTATVPADLVILDGADGLPELPSFAINLHVPKSQMSNAALEMARFVRTGLLPPQ